MAKRKEPELPRLSPTVRAGLIIIIVIGLIWMVTSMNDPWYEEPEAPEPISMADETTAATTTAAPATEVVTEAEPTTTPTEAPEETTVAIQLPPEEIMADNFDYTMDTTQFEDNELFWSFRRNTDHTPVVGYTEGVDFPFFDAFYLVPTEEKVVYLTFDEGYENGFTSKILDILKDNYVQAAFFVTGPYIESQPELVKRMKDEGHVVGNHSVSHYDGSSGDGTAFYDISNEEVVAEITGVADLMLEHTGYPIDLFFRPPALLFNERTLYLTRQQGYKSIFTSMMYQDWYVDNQPGKEVAYEHVMTNYHPGAIILLHAVSESNTEALDDIIKGLKAEGYRFGSLYEIESNYAPQ